jgi:hypothetical protein
MIEFLQAAVVFLLLTNAISVLAAIDAMHMANRFAHPRQGASSALGRKLEALLHRAG